MSLSFKVLGRPGEDNALHVVVDTGQAQHPLLFDCGEGCAARLRVSECQAIQHLCFSHFHMDHIAGFDTFFRHNYNRPDQPVSIWGPQQTIEVMHHRFQGFVWNLHGGQPGEWRVHEILKSEVRAATFFTADAFAIAHPADHHHLGSGGVLVDGDAFRLEARILNHGTTPSIGYRIEEPMRRNVDAAQLSKLDLRAGPWLGIVTDSSVEDSELIHVDGTSHRVGELRARLVVERPGQSLAYLTDFTLNGADHGEVVGWLKHTDTLVCEAQYLHQDHSLASRNHHMTTRLVGELARDAEVGELVLQHVSRRYSADEWKAGLLETKEVFANARFPQGWPL